MMMHGFPWTCCQLCGTETGGGYCTPCLDVVTQAADRKYLPARQSNWSDTHTETSCTRSCPRAVTVLVVLMVVAVVAVVVWKGLP